jgi:EAL domain-containing protein (putative c-di-GMP-specific phosphodiesterase class I)
LAERLGVEQELSDLFRRVGVARLGEAGAMDQPLFLNTHPSEMRLDTLARVAADLRAAHPDLPLVLEIHEKAVTELELIRSLRDMLREHGWYLAYDDFGAGQARLLELIQVPPDYLKFDISLIRNIHQQSATVRQVVGTLVRMAEELDIKTLAEGVEVEPEAVVCRDLGFRFVQGYYYGRPAAWGAATG